MPETGLPMYFNKWPVFLSICFFASQEGKEDTQVRTSQHKFAYTDGINEMLKQLWGIKNDKI